MIRDEVLQVLEIQRGQLVSGGELSRHLNVSRTAIWKAITTLRKKGFDIESIPGEGYRLTEKNDVMTIPGIAMHQKSKIRIGTDLEILPEVTSTNTYLKETDTCKKIEGFTVVTPHQTSGRGRLGRTFYSNKGKGIYFSILLRPQIALEQISFITIMAAAAVADALEACCGFAPEIKWVNDIYKNEKKLCGILTEASIEGESGTVDSIILGIGINISFEGVELSPDLSSIVGSLSDFSSHLPLRNEILGTVLSYLDRYYTKLLEGRISEILEMYRKRLFFLGHTITVLQHGSSYPAIALAVDDSGHLLVEKEDGTRESLFSSEISIKL